MLSLFDRLWHKDLTEEEAVKLMELGIEEVDPPPPPPLPTVTHVLQFQRR